MEDDIQDYLPTVMFRGTLCILNLTVQLTSSIIDCSGLDNELCNEEWRCGRYTGAGET